MIPPDDQVCRLCKSYRPLAEWPGRGECRNGPAPHRGAAHNGEAFLSVWPHVRETDECQAFERDPNASAESTPPVAADAPAPPEAPTTASDDAPASPASDGADQVAPADAPAPPDAPKAPPTKVVVKGRK